MHRKACVPAWPGPQSPSQSPRRRWAILVLGGAALLLAVTVVTTTMVLRPGGSTAYLRIRDVPIAHFHKALDDIVKRQDELCRQLRQLQARCPHTSSHKVQSPRVASLTKCEG